jgi:hypothetical protein
MLVRRLLLDSGLGEGCIRYLWNVRIGVIDPMMLERRTLCRPQPQYQYK